MADDYLAGALAPPSSTPVLEADATGDDNSAVGEQEGGGGVWSVMGRRRQLGPNTHYHHHRAAHAAAAHPISTTDDNKSQGNASMFFSETSVSDRDEWDGMVTEDDTVRGMDVDIMGNSRSSPSSRDRGASPSPNVFLSPALSSPGNTSLSSSNLSPHQQRFRPHRKQLPQLGPEMMVPTLGIPVDSSRSSRASGAPTHHGQRSYLSSTGTASKSNTSKSGQSGQSDSDQFSSSGMENGHDGNKPAAAISSTAAASAAASSDPEKGTKSRLGPDIIPSSLSTGIMLPNYGELAAAMAAKGHRRKRSWSSGGNAPPAHRRTRSGDGKAAGLLTGGTDWKGMELDKLPLPDPIPYDKNHKSMSNKDGGGGPSSHQHGSEGGGGHQYPTNKKVADARKMIEARYGMGKRVGSKQSLGYSETDESEADAVGEGTRAPLPPPAPTPPPPSGNSRPFSPASNADLSESTHESSHTLFSWISGRISVVSGKSKSSLARLRGTTFRSKSRADSSITFASGTTYSAVTDGASFSPTTNENGESTAEQTSSSQQFGENAPLLIKQDTSNHSSSRIDEEEVADLDDNEEDLFRQRKVMMKVAGVERDSPNGPPTRSFDRNKSTLSRPSFSVPEHEADKYPTFVCPNCQTRQRNFFTVSSAPRQFESPAGYLAFYMAIYVVSSLFIFGLEEGWPPLECVYFAVITLTTAGLGDYVPSTDGAKIICSIFIYFGVACIGLLLGSLLASGLDDASRKRAKETMVNNCPNCVRIEAQSRIGSTRRSFSPAQFEGGKGPKTWYSERSNESPRTYGDPEVISSAPPMNTVNERTAHFEDSSNGVNHNNFHRVPLAGSSGPHPNMHSQEEYAGEATPLGYGQNWSQQNYTPYEYSPFSPTEASHSAASYMQYRRAQLSPFPSNVMSRQTHTRHMSFDVQNMVNGPSFPTLAANRSRNFSVDVQGTTPLPGPQSLNTTMPTPDNTEFAQIGEPDGDDYSDSYSTTSSSGSGESSYASSDSEYDPLVPLSKVQSAKYVFLTLRQALANSVFIIAIGGFGFYFIERMTAVDAFYFTTVLLTTVGYGDIVPQTSEGKMFATVYVLIAGTVLLHNMSTISMIPIELRKRRVERAVLRQFGDQLDDAALRELATGPLVKRLQLSATRADGLDECTREMFALAMLVRLDRISEQDVRSTFAAFRRLDVDDDGKLNSRDIIMGEFQRRQTILRQSRSQVDLQAASEMSAGTGALSMGSENHTGIEMGSSPDGV